QHQTRPHQCWRHALILLRRKDKKGTMTGKRCHWTSAFDRVRPHTPNTPRRVAIAIPPAQWTVTGLHAPPVPTTCGAVMAALASGLSDKKVNGSAGGGRQSSGALPPRRQGTGQ